MAGGTSSTFWNLAFFFHGRRRRCSSVGQRGDRSVVFFDLRDGSRDDVIDIVIVDCRRNERGAPRRSC